MNASQRRIEERIAQRVKSSLGAEGATTRKAKTSPTKGTERPVRTTLFVMVGGICLVLAASIAFRHLLSMDGWVSVAVTALIPFAMGWAGVYLAAKVVTSSAEKWFFIFLFTVLLLAGIVLAVRQQKKAEGRRHLLTADERTSFEAALKAQKSGDDAFVQLACPVGDEPTCVYAGQFINLFGEAGWNVQPGVQRLTLSKAPDGVAVFRKGGNKDYMMKHWDAGAYFPLNEPHIVAIHNAFRQIHIEIDGQSNPDLDENVLMVYVGPPRDDESEPTEFTRKIDWATGKVVGPFPQSQ